MPRDIIPHDDVALRWDTDTCKSDAMWSRFWAPWDLASLRILLLLLLLLERAERVSNILTFSFSAEFLLRFTFCSITSDGTQPPAWSSLGVVRSRTAGSLQNRVDSHQLGLLRHHWGCFKRCLPSWRGSVSGNSAQTGFSFSIHAARFLVCPSSWFWTKITSSKVDPGVDLFYSLKSTSIRVVLDSRLFGRFCVAVFNYVPLRLCFACRSMALFVYFEHTSS